ncbi:MAG: alpha/beta fold hydrolase [Deltaproteobacteria bacterium]|nr:alpha/beta fold hydrolase [Deltaproteobacteria bacterium]
MKPYNDEPFLLKNPKGGAAALLIHGFTGSPGEMYPVGQGLFEKGYTVEGILLPGHGADRLQQPKISWEDWVETCEAALTKQYYQTQEPIFLVGLSMGGLLSLLLSIQHREKVRGVASLAAPTRVSDWRARYLIPWLRRVPFTGRLSYTKENRDILSEFPWSGPEKISFQALFAFLDLMHQVRAQLEKVTVPLLVIHSEKDHTAPVASAHEIYEKVRSEVKRLVLLKKSYHVISADCEKDQVIQEMTTFFESARR